jgi:thiol:disulfide interchange protein DsbD
VLAQQAGSLGVLCVLLGMVILVFAIWLMKRPKRGWPSFILILLSILLAVFLARATEMGQIINQSSGENKISTLSGNAKPFTVDDYNTALAGNDPVFVEMTAAWCITCKLNHATSINIPATLELFSTQNIHYLVGDWTNQDPSITNYLQRYGRNGVPLYVFYGSRNSQTGQRPEPVILPQILTPDIIESVILEKF